LTKEYELQNKKNAFIDGLDEIMTTDFYKVCLNIFEFKNLKLMVSMLLEHFLNIKIINALN